MLNMKGLSESEVAIGVIIFVFILMIIVLFVQSELVKISVELKTLEEDLNVVDAAHLVKDCFTKGNTSISADFLEINKGKEISDLCSLNAGDIYVSVKDLEEGNEWVFDSGGEDHTHSMPVSIFNNNKTSIGELNVKI